MSLAYTAAKSLKHSYKQKHATFQGKCEQSANSPLNYKSDWIIAQYCNFSKVMVTPLF